MNMKSLFEFKTVSIAVSGDYYQIVFHDELNTDDEPYFMIQRQFEFADGGICYFESHDETLIEYCKAKSASLSTDTLHLSYAAVSHREVAIKFGSHGTDFQELAATLRAMIPGIEISGMG